MKTLIPLPVVFDGGDDFSHQVPLLTPQPVRTDSDCCRQYGGNYCLFACYNLRVGKLGIEGYIEDVFSRLERHLL